MPDSRLTLKDIEQILVNQYKVCVEFTFFNEFKSRELRTEEISDLVDILEFIRGHEKDLAKYRQEIEIRIINHRLNELMPDNI